MTALNSKKDLKKNFLQKKFRRNFYSREDVSSFVQWDVLELKHKLDPYKLCKRDLRISDVTNGGNC